MQKLFKGITACGIVALTSACAGSGGDTRAEPTVVPVERIQIVRGDDFFDAADIASELDFVGGTGATRANALARGGIRYRYGQVPGTEEMGAVALFNPGSASIVGGGPTSGSVNYHGIFRLDHVTDIGPGPDGSFSPGSATEITGRLAMDIDFDTGVFSGLGTDFDTDAPLLDMAGEVSGADLQGTATFAGIEADLQGEVFGNTFDDANSAVAGAFVGQTETELLVGGFSAQDRIAD